MGIAIPEIGRWYRRADGRVFEVVAVDDNDGTIEIQYFDGTISESEPENWLALRPEPAEAPEDWSGSVDVNAEDLPDDIPGARYPQVIDWQMQVDRYEEIE